MATIPLGPIEPFNRLSGQFASRRYPEKALQTFKKGAVVILDAGGFVTEGAADPTNIWGVAAEDAHNKAADGDADLEVWMPYPGMLFVGNFSGASVTARSDQGKAYGLVKTGDNWHVDKTDVVATRVVVEDLDRRDTVGDINGRVVFGFRQTAPNGSAHSVGF